MNTDLSDLQQFTALDPAAEREPSQAEWNRSRQAVERMMNGEEPAQRARVLTSRRFAVGLVAAAAVAVTGVVGVPALFPSTAERAVADWMPTPGSLTGAAVLPQAKACAGGGVGGLNAGAVTPDQVVLADQRGVTTQLIVKQGAALAECLVVDTDRPLASMAMDESRPATAAKPITIETYSSRGEGDDEYSSVVGRIDPAVTGVDVILGDGTVIRTTAKATWWGAWWPGPAAGQVDAFTVRVHTAKGTTDYKPSQLTPGD
ncbi:hypothetical protein [Actinoplanes sp. M2I2]|uniref:hypothetical protein n=1 Tax=Actinoplanes sp. M2I2 TaxID=1734444 RepID=UPI0020201BCC|nr:hypothetical protein [Actinoplanes sp. M2I2]